MGNPALPKVRIDAVVELLKQGLTHREIAKRTGVSKGSVANIAIEYGLTGRTKQVAAPIIESDKKVGEFNIDEWLDWMEKGQGLRKKASYSQHASVIKLGDGKTPQIICPQGDWHVCSWGTDHRLVRDAIKEINETENAWFPLMGDMIQMSIKMRSVLEMSDNIVPPEMQAQFLEALLEKIIDKVPFSVWCNHGVEREEKQSGISMVKHILSRKVVYFNGIGHPDIQVGDQVYKFAASHKFRGTSIYNPNHSQQRYARMEYPDSDVVIGADTHRPGFSVYYEGGKKHTAVNTGTFQTGSGYAQRYFSLKTWPVMPCVALHHDKHLVVPFENLSQALEYIGQ